MWYIDFFSDLPSKSGEVAIITGGSRGLGIDVVKMLMQCDMHVIIGKYKKENRYDT